MRTYGTIGFYTYKEYFKAGGNGFVIFGMAMMFLLAQLFASAGDYFLAQWQVYSFNISGKLIASTDLRPQLFILPIKNSFIANKL